MNDLDKMKYLVIIFPRNVAKYLVNAYLSSEEEVLCLTVKVLFHYTIY